MSDGQIIEREAVRAILMTPTYEVLLMRVRPPDGGDSFWVTPGGGMDPGEVAGQFTTKGHEGAGIR